MKQTRSYKPSKPPRPRRTGGSGGKITYDPPAWRFADILTVLGSDKQIAAKLVERGYPNVPDNSITGWRLRNSIPAFWVPVIIQMGLEEKLIKSIEDLKAH